jgi:hypothetical protein
MQRIRSASQVAGTRVHEERKTILKCICVDQTNNYLNYLNSKNV